MAQVDFKNVDLQEHDGDMMPQENGREEEEIQVDAQYGYWSKRAKLFRRKAFKRSLPKTATAAAKTTEEDGLKKTLGAVDLLFLGIGGIVGAGVFVLTGVGAHDAAGPAILVSYLIASFAAGLSALCYTEFAVDIPVAGGAFNYIALECGELLGWIAGWNLVLEYTLSSAAVGRGFTSYTSTMLGMEPEVWLLNVGPFNLDVSGFVIVLIISAMLAYGTKESARFNTIVTIVNLAVIAFVIAVGAPRISPADFRPFAPKGITGIFNGAAIVFFSYVGFDTVATTAEETNNPSVDLPVGIIGSLAVCTILYAAMCAALTGMVYYEDIDVNAPFADAFRKIGMGWATEIVSIGAVTGIVTALLVSLLGCARIYAILARSGLLPAKMARINKQRGTPLNATIVTGLSSGLLTFLFDIEILAELVSIGTLFVFSIVSAAVLIRHYNVVDGLHDPMPSIIVRLVLQVGCSIGLCLSVLMEQYLPALVFCACYVILTCSYYMLSRNVLKLKFRVPLIPIIPSLSILFNVYLISSLGLWAYVRFAVWNIAGVLVYFFYGCVHSDDSPSPPRGQIALVPVKRDSLSEDTSLLGGTSSSSANVK